MDHNKNDSTNPGKTHHRSPAHFVSQSPGEENNEILLLQEIGLGTTAGNRGSNVPGNDTGIHPGGVIDTGATDPANSPLDIHRGAVEVLLLMPSNIPGEATIPDNGPNPDIAVSGSPGTNSIVKKFFDDMLKDKEGCERLRERNADLFAEIYSKMSGVAGDGAKISGTPGASKFIDEEGVEIWQRIFKVDSATKFYDCHRKELQEEERKILDQIRGEIDL